MYIYDVNMSVVETKLSFVDRSSKDKKNKQHNDRIDKLIDKVIKLTDLKFQVVK